ncbi:trehalose-phosphatase [candidate division LCP-89 bacterium B3_LCP]|uniref:Trehalose 6-phosphate phosphatase n=1 Tax=candidate division LCP-89 bacterium B3_LCP TaxID=2012998 RepID=A0A532UVS7_UNCL8|nr:MAG: trehalose-phosphatase [candidate division LCP-89 bacterium B3_LCP]
MAVELINILDARDILSEAISGSDRVLLGLDFDGTLSPIVTDPAAARMSTENREFLQRICCNNKTDVAILSGRSLDDLRSKVDLDGVFLAGDHGLTIRNLDGSVFCPEGIKPHGDLLAQIEHIESLTSTIAGLYLEPKEFSLTVHYRQASIDTGEKLRPILKKIVEGTDFQLQSGRMCWEINPIIRWNKGDAYNWVRNHLTSEKENLCQLYVGDDRTDENVFAVIPSEGFAIQVMSDEKLKSSDANYKLDDQAEVALLLEIIEQQLNDRN